MIFLLGATAAGKSRVAMKVARRTGAEIVAVDAFQIYRGLDIGTGKATKTEREEVRHHLLDVVEPEAKFSAADYAVEAGKVMQDLSGRGKNAIWVGGTGLYHQVMTVGLVMAPGTEAGVAAELEKKSTEELAEEIRRVDPLWAGKGDLQNRRRVVRALAVWRQTGRAMSDWQKKETAKGKMAGVVTFALMPKVDELAEKIKNRVRAMWEVGWVEEVSELRKRVGWEGCAGSRAIGYAEVEAVVRGEMRKDEACDKIVTATRAYAKRQLTWLRKIPNLKVIETEKQSPLGKVGVEMLVRALAGEDIS